MIRRPPRSTLSSSSAASDVYKRQFLTCVVNSARANPPHVHTLSCTLACEGQYLDTTTIRAPSLTPTWNDAISFELEDMPSRLRQGALTVELVSNGESLGSMRLALLTLPMAQLPPRWHQLSPGTSGYLELQAWFHTEPPATTTQLSLPVLKYKQPALPALDTTPLEVDPSEHLQALNLMTPRDIMEDKIVVDPAPSPHEVAMRALELAGLGRQKRNGQWAGVEGAVMRPTSTVLTSEYLPEAKVTVVSLDGEHTARVGDAIGVKSDCLPAPPPAEPLWINSGVTMDFNVQQDFFNCTGDASALEVGRLVQLGGREMRVKAIQPHLDCGDTWVQLDQEHGCAEGSALLVQSALPSFTQAQSPRSRTNSCIDPDVCFVPTSFSVAGNVHQTWFNIQGDAQTVLYPGLRISIGSQESMYGGFGRSWTIQALNYSVSKQQTWVSLDREHNGHVAEGDRISILCENLDNTFIHLSLIHI
eukprot:TRINITY_DN10012_c0_g1_i6.p1 TRINITY_DN10012_c0_g1~~TRINITY_DN10012_c0_g1_i6.p1  ORF type:complete len:475 (-),score=114.23 TRINITY_DN10012_c0_g1_i6:3-1427(-)